jgi:hypothetical protein
MRRATSVLLVPVAFVLTASGGWVASGYGESAKQYVEAAAKALGAARSLRIAGSTSVSAAGRLDLVLYSDGDVQGGITLNGDLVQVRIVNRTDYFHASVAYWMKLGKLSTATAEQLASRWVSTPNSSASGFGSNLGIRRFAAEIAAASGLSIIGHRRIDGVATVGIRSSRGGELWIAATGTPYPIEEVKLGSSGASLTFSGWDSFKLPTPPSKVVALASLGS